MTRPQQAVSFTGADDETPLIAIRDEITAGMARRIEQELARHAYPREIAVTLTSSGGDTEAADAIYAALRRTKARITVRVDMICASAGIAILLAGDWREADPCSRFHLHDGATALRPVRWTAAEHRSQAERIEAHDRKLIAFIAARTGARKEEIAMLMRTSKPLDVEQARVIGLIHRVI
jgi:ATP-dependent protease ClpP protease subunit